MIHVPKDELIVNVPLMLVRRLFEELLRYPERRAQLLEKKVSPLVSLRQAIYIDNQYIVPDSSMAWYDLLRTDWIQTTKERPKFYEEMSAVSAPPVYIPSEKEGEDMLPEFLIDLFGEKEESKGLYLYRPEISEGAMPSVLPFLVSVGVFPEDIGMENEDLALSVDALQQLTLRIRRPVIQINLQAGQFDVDTFGPPERKQKDPNPFILIALDLDQGGPAMLSLSPQKPIPIPLEKMTSGLKILYEDRIIVGK